MRETTKTTPVPDTSKRQDSWALDHGGHAPMKCTLMPLVEGGTPHREALSIHQSRYVAAMDLTAALPAKRLTATFSLAPACVQPSSTASPTADTSSKRAPTPTASPTAGPTLPPLSWAPAAEVTAQTGYPHRFRSEQLRPPSRQSAGGYGPAGADRDGYGGIGHYWSCRA